MSFFACLLPLLALVAWRDIATRTIPDAASVVFALVGIAIRLWIGPQALLLSLLSAALLFGILLFFFARGALGGGDVKLMSALALGMAPAAIWDFLVLTAAAGGVLGLTYLALSRLLPAHPARPATAGGLLARIGRVEAWRIRRRGPLPYGVAIAFGGAMILLRGA
ncbi:A24 family peptidase [Teichococcus oryzae]|uniref:Prepilin peptidase n=1 Tax=Teichococcus oryzae TaxID=1608942 RepID=A0A5B2T9K8_9PROT|nr:prepilin peptidase [Pseudoroseomonas oryzae]KAA2211302.1 prepilin peptidase [Pseudoroseomonas oryzae]